MNEKEKESELGREKKFFILFNLHKFLFNVIANARKTEEKLKKERRRRKKKRKVAENK